MRAEAEGDVLVGGREGDGEVDGAAAGGEGVGGDADGVGDVGGRGDGGQGGEGAGGWVGGLAWVGAAGGEWGTYCTARWRRRGARGTSSCHRGAALSQTDRQTDG